MRTVLIAPLLVALIATALPAVATAAGPTILIRSVKSVDAAKHTVVFPLHRGTAGGKTVWYILTDASDATTAGAQRLDFAPLLAGVGIAQTVTVKNGIWNFSAAPDFSQGRVFKPGPTGFPPAAAAPGGTAPAAYSPFVKVAGSKTVYNAPIIATGDGPLDVTTHANTEDRVLAVAPDHKSVTLLLANGFAEGKRVLYISTEASDPGAAAIERATLDTGLNRAPKSARLRIFVIVNGRSQGLADLALHGNLNLDATQSNSATLRTSQNVLGGLPAATPNGGIYDPFWDVYIGAWTPAAIAAGKNIVLTSSAAIQKAVAAKLLTGPGGKPFGPVGFAVNCPVVAIEQ